VASPVAALAAGPERFAFGSEIANETSVDTIELMLLGVRVGRVTMRRRRG